VKNGAFSNRCPHVLSLSLSSSSLLLPFIPVDMSLSISQHHNGLSAVHLAPETITWPAVEQALRVIKGLTTSTAALRKWLYDFSEAFEPIWDEIASTVRQQIYGNLLALPTAIATGRRIVIDADRRREGDDYQPRENTGIQQDDLVSGVLLLGGRANLYLSIAAYRRLQIPRPVQPSRSMVTSPTAGM